VADTASIGSVLIPEMEKKGYPRDFAAAVTVSGSVQAILIPPSHNAVIYSLAAGGTVSIAALFMAGVLPGLLMGLTLAALCLVIARQKNYPKGEVIPLKQALKITVDALWGLMTMVIILGGILSGVFTANESASHRGHLGLLRHDVRLPRLPLARPAQAGAPHGEDGDGGDDPDRLCGLLRLPDDADADPA
jgi:tripartite ATP-independent transporter DctM subunit